MTDEESLLKKREPGVFVLFQDRGMNRHELPSDLQLDLRAVYLRER
jgi:hypothetical protein